MQVYHSFDARTKAVVLFGGTGDPQVTALPLGSQSNSFVVVYFKVGQLSSLPGSPRLSCVRIPVETIAPPVGVTLIISGFAWLVKFLF